MLSMIEIDNFKSIEQLTIKPGALNLLIGENGCGKSNILEAIVFAAAAEANKLDNEFLANRGIRVAPPKLMRAAFENERAEQPISLKLCFEEDKCNSFVKLQNDNTPYSKWHKIEPDAKEKAVDTRFSFSTWLGTQLAQETLQHFPDVLTRNSKDEIQKWLTSKEFAAEFEEKNQEHLETFKAVESHLNSFKDFIIYSPENTALRNFEAEGQIEPLGIHGEGLLKLLKVTQQTEPEKLEVITKALELFGWYESIELPKDIDAQEAKIQIKDRFIGGHFDQRSANEGFLFILFYITLMVSKETPKIFAIDNIDASLNPKLCTKLISMMAELAQKYGKQVFLTGHNPALLDGLNLTDPQQKLFVISRNKQGNTRVKTIEPDDLPKSSSGEAVKLSEAMLRGYLGGLPKSF